MQDRTAPTCSAPVRTAREAAQLAPVTDWSEMGSSEHFVQFYETSDFLTLLNLWHFYHESARHLSGSKLRKLCRENFLSYMRLREWHDVHQQIRELVLEMGLDRKSLLPPKRDAPTKHRVKRRSHDQRDTGRQTVR